MPKNNQSGIKNPKFKLQNIKLNLVALAIALVFSMGTGFAFSGPIKSIFS